MLTPPFIVYLNIGVRFFNLPQNSVRIVTDENIDLIRNLDAKSKNNSLFYASELGNYNVAKVLIENGAEVNCIKKNKDTPLIVAASNGYFEIVDLLIANGANVNYINAAECTPLVLTAAKGNFEVSQLLIENGADINYQKKNGQSVFIYACVSGNPALVLYLLNEKGVDSNIPNEHCEANGKKYHILGDYYLALDDYDKARDSYNKAKNYYDESIEGSEWEENKIFLKQMGLVALGATLSASQYYLAKSQNLYQNKQSAQISALKYASSTKTGIQGYSDYLSKYNQGFISTNFAPIEKPTTREEETYYWALKKTNLKN